MPMWPFGRRGKRATKLKASGPEAVSHAKEEPETRQNRKIPSTSKDNNERATTTSRPVRRRLSSKRGRARNARSLEPSSQPADEKIAPQLPPLDNLPANRFSYLRESAEDITALPNSKELRTSPHLRPATRETTADIRYNFHSKSLSRSSLKLDEKPSKLQRPQTVQSKRSLQDSYVRRKQSKKKKDQELREEEIRAMSAPIAPMKRSATQTGMLRRDSKKMRGGLNKNFERPMSEISLPLEDSVHSSMSGTSDPKMFRITSFNVFSPRPTFRLSNPQQYEPSEPRSGLTESVKNEQKREKRTEVDRDALEKGQTIDGLADDLDASGLRELMERDQRRREKRRKLEEDRARRKLQRRAERERAEELRREEGLSPAREDVGEKALGLGVETMPDFTATPTYDPVNREEKGLEKGLGDGTYYGYPSQEQLPLDSRDQRLPTPQEAPEDVRPISRRPETPLEEPVLSTAQVVRYSQASPTQSPVQSPTRHTRHSSGISQIASLTPEPTPPPAAPLDSTLNENAPSEVGRRRRSGWAALFRRGGLGRSPSDWRKEPQDMSFSNTSRESMSKQPLPAHLQQNYARASSGTPTRTRSRFREDLPELPISPPDSRVQSPVAMDVGHGSIASERDLQHMPDTRTDAESSAAGSPVDGPFYRTTTASPTGSAAQMSAIQSTSLASVDSEGSWLSGRPAKRSSPQTQFRSSVGSSPTQRVPEDMYSDELGMADDEYFRRLAPGEDDDQKTMVQSMGHAARKSTGKDSDVEGEVFKLGGNPLPPETLVHEGVARHPTVVHRDRGVMKSREGLLNDFRAGNEEAPTSSPTALTPETGSPVDDSMNQEESPFLGRAQSVDYGKGQKHARHLSAGSAKLLDFTKGKRASGSSVGPV